MFLFRLETLRFIDCLEIWTSIIMVGSFLYHLTAFATGHHLPSVVHEGDEIESLDFGIYQLSATVDRTEANSNLFMSLTNFGHHSLHHMFPSLDHSILPQLEEVFIETCTDFQVKLRKYYFLYCFVGNIEQLNRKKKQ